MWLRREDQAGPGSGLNVALSEEEGTLPVTRELPSVPVTRHCYLIVQEASEAQGGLAYLT